jgi:hypothetical protein
MNNSFSDLLFGVIAVKNSVISREQLDDAIRHQWDKAGGGIGPTLGEVCQKLGYLSEEEVNAVLWAQAKSEALLEDALCGQIAIRNGILTQEQLDSALDEQKRRGPGARLGHILIERGDLSLQAVHAILTSQKRMKAGPSAELEEPTITLAEAAREKKKSGNKKAKQKKRKRSSKPKKKSGSKKK